MKTTRRTTLALLAAAAMQGRARAASGKTVIVIGAGLAGLSAARALTSAGAKVIILEARQRLGGRIWTSMKWPDMPMDLGASWIHGVTGNPLTKLADAAGAKRLATSYDSGILLDEDGREAGIDDEMDDAEDLVAKARKSAERKDKDEPLRAAIEDSPRWQKTSPRQRRIVRHYINSTIEQEYGGDWSEASAWSIDDSKEFEGGDVLFPGGFSQIITYMAKGLDVRLGQAVSRIDATADGVAVHTSGGVIEGDHVIVTVPIGVLQSGAIGFGEPLAAVRQKAIDSLRMGLLNKCWLRFPRIAWPDDVDWIEWLGPRDGSWAEWVSLAHGAKLPVLLGFHAGAQARAMEKLDDRAMAAAAHDALKAMFGSDFPAPEAAQVTRWSKDPHALGSYSFHAVGTSPATRKALAGADWDGRLIFAGEATSTQHYGTAHGAVMTGEAAAGLI